MVSATTMAVAVIQEIVPADSPLEADWVIAELRSPMRAALQDATC
jgi:hypothetical protein